MKTQRFTSKSRTLQDVRRFVHDTVTKHFDGAMVAAGVNLTSAHRFVVVVEAQSNQLVFRIMRRREFDTSAADGGSV